MKLDRAKESISDRNNRIKKIALDLLERCKDERLTVREVERVCECLVDYSRETAEL